MPHVQKSFNKPEKKQSYNVFSVSCKILLFVHARFVTDSDNMSLVIFGAAKHGQEMLWPRGCDTYPTVPTKNTKHTGGFTYRGN